MSINDTATALQNFFAEQKNRYDEILLLSREQLALVKSSQATVLMEVLGRKQELIRELDTAAANARDTITTWESERELAPEQTRDAVRQAHGLLTAVMTKVIELEDQAKALINQDKGSSGKQLINLQKGKQMLRAYGAPPPPDGAVFTDKRK